MMRLLKPFRSLYVTAEDIGRAMLAATAEGMRGRILENAAIRDLADAWRRQSRVHDRGSRIR